MQNRPEGRNIFLKSYKSKGAYESKTAFKRKTAFLKSYKSKGAYALSHYPETRVFIQEMRQFRILFCAQDKSKGETMAEIKGKTRSLTEGKPLTLILAFGLPILIGDLFQQLYNLADAIIVGRLLGTEAFSSVGCTGSITFFILGCVQGMAVGFSVITAQRFGAKRIEDARKSFVATIWLAIMVSVVFTAIFAPLVMPILKLLRTDELLIDNAYNYLFYIMLIGITTSMFFNVFFASMRALGDSRTPLFFLIAACIINIVLDLVFIAVFNMGVAGASLATVISQGLSAIMCFIYMRKKFPVLRIGFKDFVWDTKEILLHAKIGFPMGFQMSIIAIGSISVTFVVNTLGTAAVAAFTSSVKIENIVTAPLKSFGAAMSAFVGQNYGAGKIGQAKEGVKKCLFLNIAIGVTVGALVIIFYEPLTRFFIGDNSGSINPEEILEFAKQYIIVTCSNYWILATIFVLRNSIQGLGNSFVPTIAGVGELVMRVAGVFCLSPWIGFLGASIANPMAWLGSFIPLTVSYVHLMRKLTKEGIKAVV